MFDIHFYMKTHELKKQFEAGKKFDKEFLMKKFEEYRAKEPVVYNIETTNACNMRCKMCPRTTMMTRKIENLPLDVFVKIVDQIRPWTKKEWGTWQDFVEKEYGIPRDSTGENHFFLHIIPQVIQLHGYGEPLLAKDTPEHVKILHEKGFKSYFSCNPSNVNVETTEQMFKNGLDYIKYSMESVDDIKHKEIRGTASNFTESYKKILKLLELKKQHDYKTTIIITMLDLNQPNQKEEYRQLKEAFKGKDVYIYIKSEDQQWYRKDYHGTNSVHWSEFCKHPWMSMTIKSNGEAAMCMEDFNNEIILGDATKESLYDIWNGEKYKQFRLDHFNCTPGLKCVEKCDMKMIGDYLS